MTPYLAFRYLHLLFLFIMVGSVITQQFLIKRNMTGADLKRIRKVDLWYGISAIAVVAMGLVLWFEVGKPSDFYTYNRVFLLKVALFSMVGLLSVYPTLYFRNSKKCTDPNEMVKIPALVILVVRLELAILLLIPILAVLMASGVGYAG